MHVTTSPLSENRWMILAVLFLARMSMAFQFQSVAALSGPYRDAFGVSLSDVGFLIGLYFIPGIFIALPGGAMGRFFGDKKTVTAGMMLMVAGAIMTGFTQDWSWQLTGRIIAGIGGVILNVLMSKLVVDYFQHSRLSTAMGIFVTSWPIGIALALVVLPILSASSGLAAALHSVSLFTLLAMIGFMVMVPAPSQRQASAITLEPLRGRVLLCQFLASIVWAFYNGAIAMVFSFAATMLTEREFSILEASSMTSLTLFVIAASVPLGGILADVLKRPVMVIFISLAGFAMLLPVTMTTDHVALVFILLGLFAGAAAGPAMGLPARVLSAGNTGIGMGLFFALYYLIMVLSPMVAGSIADRVGTASVTMMIGVVMLVVALMALMGFEWLRPKRLYSTFGGTLDVE